MDRKSRGYTVLGALVVVVVVVVLRFMDILIFDAEKECDSQPSNVALAAKESDGFFDDIPEREWAYLKARVHDVYPNTKKDGSAMVSNVWFQNNYEPDFACRHERRVGSLGDGGKWVCDPHRLKPNGNRRDASCLVYSVGSNGETAFEDGVKRSIGEHCEVHVFDFTNYTDVVTAAGATMHVWGLSSSSSVEPSGRLFLTLKETVAELGHAGRTVDIFKIDCEGCEWSSFLSWFEAPIKIRQLLIEVHGTVDAGKGHNFFEKLYNHSYVIFHKEPNILAHGEAVEYAFLKLTRDFFLDEDGDDVRLKKFQERQ